jgi:hypothetical protein
MGVLIVAGSLLLGCRNEDPSDKQSMQYDFNRTTVGSLATGWMAAETGGAGTPAMWRIVRNGFAPSPPHVIAVVANQNTAPTCNLLMAHSGAHRDLQLSVYVRANSGEQQQGGGLFWRAQDAENYYVAYWNPLETALNIGLVKNGRLRELAATTVRADPTRWQKLTVRHVGNEISAVMNEDTPLVVTNKSFAEAGKVGLWIQADATSSFDDLDVTGYDLEPLGLEE